MIFRIKQAAHLSRSARALLAALGIAASSIVSASPYLPGVTISSAPLMSPAASSTAGSADAYYCGTSTGCSASGSVVYWNSGYPVEIVALANALHRNPDLIYEYVRNNIEIVPTYGLSKGALGALIDQNGTAFDQAQLMVDLLRASGFTANFQAGTISLTKDQASAWLGGVTDAAQLTKILADGGIPATVTPATGVVSNVLISHIWVQATIPGSTCNNNCLFDPAYKPHVYTAGANLATALGWSDSDFITAAQSGTAYKSGTKTVTGDSGSSVTVPYVSGINGTNIQTKLKGYASNLLTYLRNNNLAGTPISGSTPMTAAQMDDLLGRRDITPYAIPQGGLRQTALPYTAQSQHTWTGNIPDAYRTVLTVAVDNMNVPMFVDEIYGRSLQFALSPGTLFTNVLTLKLDGVVIATGANESGTISDGGTMTLTVSHPYAAVVNGAQYMYQQITRTIPYGMPIAIVHGWGPTSERLLAKLSGEGLSDSLQPLGNVPQSDKPYPTNYDLASVRAGADWLGQESRMVDLQARIRGVTVQQHHLIGLSYYATNRAFGPQSPPDNIVVSDGAVRLGVDTALSLNSNGTQSGTDQNRLVLARSIPAASEALEASVFTQMARAAPPASVGDRFNWGNNNSATFYLLGSTTEAGSLFPDPPANSYCSTVNLGLASYSEIKAYADQGYWVITSGNVALGPGDPCGASDGSSSFPSHYSALQRGAAFVALKPDNSSVANVIVEADGSFKGGGAGTEPQYPTDYDATKAADLVKDDFKDRTKDFGIDLQTGEFTYQGPTELKIGQGDFPYSLSLSHSFKAGSGQGDAREAPGGWVQNWDIRANLTSSGQEALGIHTPSRAVATLAALYAEQQIYNVATIDGTILPRFVLAPFVMQWWTQQILDNQVTVTSGTSGQSFGKLIDGTFEPPPGQTGTLVQTGAVAITDATGFGVFQPDYSAVSFSLTSLTGDVRSFPYWSKIYPTATTDPGAYRKHYGWHLTSWTFPQGVSVNLAYDTNVNDDDVLLTVTNSLGRKLTFNYDTCQFFCPLDSVTDSSNRSVTYAVSPTNGILVTNPSGDVRRYEFARVWSGFNYTDYEYHCGPLASGGRPACMQLLKDVYDPDDTSNPKIHITYDALNRVASYQDAVSEYQSGGHSTSPYDASRGAYQFFVTGGTRGERMDPAGFSYTAYYDQWGRAIQYIDELGRSTSSTYDGLNRVLTRTAPLGDSTWFKYDTNSRITLLRRNPYASSPATSPSSLSISATYDPTCGKIASITDANSKSTYWYYKSGTCLLDHVVQPQVTDGKTGSLATPTTYYNTYNSRGQLLTFTDPSGVPVSYSYYESGNSDTTSTNQYERRARLIDPGTSPHLNLTSTYNYDTMGDINSVVDGNGHQTTYGYDNDRRFTTATSPSATCMKGENVYTGGLLVKTRNALKCAPNEASDADWQVTTTQYSPSGKPELVTDASGFVTETHYDVMDRPQDVIQWLDTGKTTSRTTHTTYNGDGTTYQVFKGWGGSDQITYSTTTYDSDGKPLTVADANGNATTSAYDGYERLFRLCFPDSTGACNTAATDYEQYAYDNNGNLTTKRNRDGASLSFGFDALNREVSRTVPANSQGHFQRTLTTHYDLASRKWDSTVVDTETGTSTTQTLYDRYDTAGRATSVDDSYLSGIFNSTCTPGSARCYASVLTSYDAANNRTAETVYGLSGASYSENYSYDTANRVSTVSDSTATHATYAYDSLSRRCSLLNSVGGACVWGNSAQTSEAFQANDDLQALTHTVGGTSWTWSLTHNGAHQITAETQNDNNVGEMKAATTPLTFAVNNLNQYSTVNGVSYNYNDSAGHSNANLTGDGTWTYEYDEENRLRRATGPHTVVYDYDPQGRRRSKNVDSAITYYTSDDTEEVAEWPSNGSLSTRYVNGGATDDHIAMLDYTCGTPPCRWYYHVDWHGTTLIISYQTTIGNIGYKYDAYGLEPASDPNGGNPFRYTGRRFDQETGLYYYRARYYSPALGRFLQTDPIGSASDLNWYAYTGEDPISNADPLGTCTGSHQENSDGSCRDGGGDTTGLSGQAQGIERERAAVQMHINGFVAKFTAYGATAGGGLVAAASLAVDAGTGGLNILATPVEIGAGAMGGAMMGGSLGALADKMSSEISGITTKIQGPEGEQYSLRASSTGLYPDVRGGMVQLNAGDVWKYGQTINPASRYSAATLGALGVDYVTEYRGTQMQILIQEKLKLYGYFLENGSLPPGNSIFR